MTSLSETRDRATVVVVGRSDRPEARMTAQRAVDWLARHGHTVVALPQDIAVLAVDRLEARDDPFSSADLVLSIGGDGTMLRAVSLVDGRPVPVLGINVGLLGYLAEVEPANLEASLDRFFTGQYVTERRLVLEVEVRHLDGRRDVLRALNEASFEKT